MTDFQFLKILFYTKKYIISKMMLRLWEALRKKKCIKTKESHRKPE